MQLRNATRGAVLLAVLLNSLSAGAVGYEPNDLWHRSVDWVPGALPGSTTGNASPDQNGNPVWRYSWVQGGGFGEANPWYKNDSTLMVWDDSWWGAGIPTWARAYKGPGADNINTNPPINQYRLYQDMSDFTFSWDYMPVVDWINPVGDGAIVNIGGRVKFVWEGGYRTTGSPTAPIDAVLSKYDASSASYVDLWAGSYSNPTAGGALSSASLVDIPVSIAGVQFDQGDWLRISFKVLSGSDNGHLWIGMQDALVVRLVAVVPEPAESALLASGLVALAIGMKRFRRARARA